ncbi:MAG: CsbD family protein [Pseudomonadota bacterium]
MNTCQLSGGAIYLMGKLGEHVGRITGNRNLQTAGYQKQIAGRARYAIGDAQQLIKRCTKQQDNKPENRPLPAQLSQP